MKCKSLLLSLIFASASFAFSYSQGMADFTASTVEFCQNDGVTFMNNSVADTAWMWDFGAGATPSSVNTPGPHIVHYNSAGFKTISLIINNGEDTMTKVAFVEVLPSPTANFSLDTVCFGDTTTFTDLSVAGGPGIDGWTWDFDDMGATSTDQNPTYYFSACGIYNVLLTLEEAGCIDDTLISINVPCPPDLAYEFDTVCLGQPTEFRDLSLAGDAPITAISWYIFDLGATPTPPISATDTQTGSNAVQIFTSCISAIDGAIIQVEDANGCIVEDTILVVVHCPPTVILSSDTVVCAGSAIPLSVSGGISYSWAPDTSLDCNNCPNVVATPTSSTTYLVEATSAEGCASIGSVNVGIHNSAPASISNDTTLCPTECAQLLATGGTQYNWSPTVGLSDSSIANPIACPLSTTSYSVTITDSVCVETLDITITRALNPIANLGNDTIICDNDSLLLNAGSGNTYLWHDASTNNTFNVTSSGNYSVTVTDMAGCQSSDTVNAVVNLSPNVDLGRDTFACYSPAESYPLFAGLGFASYNWSTGATTSGIFFTPVSGPSNVLVEVTDSNGCVGSDDINIYGIICLNIESIVKTALSVYPNPVVDVLTIESDIDLNNVIITNAIGKTVWSGSINNGSNSINTDNWAEGIYLLTDDQHSFSLKILKSAN